MRLGQMTGDGRRVVLWRHGETDWNVRNIAQGQMDVPLNETGLAQALQAAPLVATYGPSLIVSSDLGRARSTALELASITGVRLETDERLREIHVGLRQGLCPAEFAQQHPEEWRRSRSEPDYRIPGAETDQEVAVRTTAVLTEVVGRLSSGQTAVLVGHGAAFRVLIPSFLGIGIEHAGMFAGMDNCARAVLQEHPAEGWRIAAYNVRGVVSGVPESADGAGYRFSEVPGPA